MAPLCEQALTPDSQLLDLISECGRKGPSGPVCNCCPGVCVDDSLLYWSESAVLNGLQSLGYKFVVLLQWLQMCFSPLTALVFDFPCGLYITIHVGF